MKKTYKNPTLEVVDVQSAEILAGSMVVDPTKEIDTQMSLESSFSDWGGDEYVIDDDAMNIGF